MYCITVNESWRVVRSSDSLCQSRNCPGFDPSILRCNGMWGAADEAALSKLLKEKKTKKNPLYVVYSSLWSLISTYMRGLVSQDITDTRYRYRVPEPILLKNHKEKQFFQHANLSLCRDGNYCKPWYFRSSFLCYRLHKFISQLRGWSPSSLLML